MPPDSAVYVCRQALLLVLIVSAPPVMAALVIGLCVSLLQAATQLQEQSLTFVPKLVGVALVLVFGGLWMLRQLAVFTADILEHTLAQVGQ
jgi:flagellar biosynthetic protein FliQ